MIYAIEPKDLCCGETDVTKSHKIGFGSFTIRRHCHVDFFCKSMRRKTAAFSVRTRSQCVRRPCRRNKEIEESDRPKKIPKSIILQRSNHERINIYWSLRIFFSSYRFSRWAFLFSFFGRSTLLINPINHFPIVDTVLFQFWLKIWFCVEIESDPSTASKHECVRSPRPIRFSIGKWRPMKNSKQLSFCGWRAQSLALGNTSTWESPKLSRQHDLYCACSPGKIIISCIIIY